MDKMSKKIKFALILKNDEEVRTVGELKEQLEKNFDSSIIECFLDGKDESKLAQWLRDHHYRGEAEKLNRLWKSYKAQRKNSAENATITPAVLIKEIYSVFKLLPPNIEDSQSIDINKIEEISKKKDELEDKIDDVDALKHISQVARNQNELDKILNSYADRKNAKQISIYLLSDGAEKYSLKYEYLEQTNLRFVGVDCVNDDDEVQIEVVKTNGDKWTAEEYDKFSKKKENRNRFSNLTIWLVKDRLFRYMDASFPLIYLNTFEEDKADEIITSAAAERKIYEWNAEGFFEKK